jgi:predicted phosphodiesterase
MCQRHDTGDGAAPVCATDYNAIALRPRKYRSEETSMQHAHTDARESDTANWTVTRRDFLRTSGCVIAGLSVGVPFANAAETDRKTKLRFGIVTDAHYADAAPTGSRHHRTSLAKMTECVNLMNDKKVDFLVELGDFKDQGKPVSEKATLKYLQTIEQIFRQFKAPRYHVLGNHDADSISKEQFLARVENTGIKKGAKYYSFDSEELHFVVLDANYKANGADYDHGNFSWKDTNIPHKELDWLKKHLASSSKPVIAFIHQQIDGKGSHYVKNAAEVRQILQESKRVLAVFQGHNHSGAYSHIQNIHYYTLKAMVEGAGDKNSAYGIVEVHDNYDITVVGYRRAPSKKMPKA